MCITYKMAIIFVLDIYNLMLNQLFFILENPFSSSSQSIG